jgi:hypothetical protein
VSYCRFSEGSDLYLFDATLEGRHVICCCGCDLPDGEYLELEAVVAHVERHRANGDQVPEEVLDLLAETARLAARGVDSVVAGGQRLFP